MNAALRQICCCRWDHGVELRVWTDPECILHGKDAPERKHRLELERDVDHWRRALSSSTTELVTWYRRHKVAVRRLAEAQKKLKELDHV